MRRFWCVAVALVVAAVVGAPPASAAPGNDDIADASTIASLPFSTTASTYGASTEVAEPLACGPRTGTVWYRYTPAVSGPVRAHVTTDEFGVELGVYEMVLGAALIPSGCGSGDADEPSSELGKAVTFEAVSGHTYYIQVGGYFSLVPGSCAFYPCDGEFVLGVEPA